MNFAFEQLVILVSTLPPFVVFSSIEFNSIELGTFRYPASTPNVFPGDVARRMVNSSEQHDNILSIFDVVVPLNARDLGPP